MKEDPFLHGLENVELPEDLSSEDNPQMEGSARIGGQAAPKRKTESKKETPLEPLLFNPENQKDEQRTVPRPRTEEELEDHDPADDNPYAGTYKKIYKE